MNGADLAAALREHAYLEGDFVLRSGRRSRYYLDKYRFETRPDLLGPLGERIAAAVAEHAPGAARIAGPELGAAGIDDYDWEKLRGGGFAALDVADGNTVVRGRFAHDLAWGNGGTAVVIAAGLVCGIGRAGEVDVYSTAGSDHPVV